MHNAFRFPFAILLSLFFFNSIGQSLKGKISEENGSPIPYATIYIKELSLGTTSNIDGLFSLEIPEGTYTVHFRSLGFEKRIETITIKKGADPLDIILKEQVVQIGEVRVFGNDEDPAYRVMRKAIGLASFHMNQIKSYQSEVYLKGTAKFEKVPLLVRNRLKKEGFDVKSGDVFVDESLSTITFKSPDKYTQKVKSINSSFPDGFNFDFTDFLASSLYQNNVERMVSPLSRNAFSYYKFVYEGYDYDGSYIVNKIKVIPKRNNKQFYKGYIYIIEDLWCLHSYNLGINIPFGDVTIRQIFDEVRPNIWLPVGHNHFIKGGLLGLKGSFKFGGSIKYTKLVPNTKLLASRERMETSPGKESIPEVKKAPIPLTKKAEKSSKRKKQIEVFLLKDDLSNRDMSRLSRLMDKESRPANNDTSKSLEIIDKTKLVIAIDAREIDTLQWADYRTIPLTIDENNSLIKRDSLIKIDDPDSADTTGIQKKNAYRKYIKPVLFGKKWDKDTTITINYPGILAVKNFGFNPVDGWYFSQNIKFIKLFSPGNRLYLTPWAAYAFNRKSFLCKLESEYTYSPLKRGRVKLDIGKVTNDFNREYGINPLLNSVSSLFFKENYARHFEDRYISVKNRIDIRNGLVLHAGIEYHDYKRLENTTNFSFFRSNWDYYPNIPNNDEITDESLNNQISTSVEIKLEYTPRNYYRMYNGVKVMAHSFYPLFWLSYRKGIRELFGSNADYDYLEAGVRQWIKTGEAANFAYEIKTGWFPRNKQIHFSEYYHNNVQKVPFLLKEHRHAFFLPDYYSLSTSNKFFEAHASYKSPFIALKYLPLIEKTMWREMVWTSYYNKPGFNNYFEAGYSLLDVLFNFNIGVYVGWEDWKYSKVGVNLLVDF